MVDSERGVCIRCPVCERSGTRQVEGIYLRPPFQIWSTAFVWLSYPITMLHGRAAIRTELGAIA